jgi:hypothetical protein
VPAAGRLSCSTVNLTDSNTCVNGGITGDTINIADGNDLLPDCVLDLHRAGSS